MTSAESAYLFRHALLRDAAYQVWTPTERGRMHLHAADSMEMLLGEAGPFALETAGHLRAAAALEGNDTLAAREAECLDRGVDYAWRVYDHAACISGLSRLLELTQASEPRARVCDRLAGAFDRVGRMGEAAEAALECVRLTGDLQLRASALGRACWFLCYLHRLDEARGACRQLETIAAGGGPGLRHKSLAARSVLLYFEKDLSGAIRASHEAVALASAAGIPPTEVLSDLSNLAALKLQTGDFAGAEETGQQAARLAREAGRLEMQALTWHILAQVSTRRLDFREAESRRRLGLAAAQHAASPIRTSQARYHLGLLLLNTGRVEDALPELARAAVGYDEQGRRDIACHARFCISRAYIWRGWLERARHELDAIAPVGPPDGTCRVLPQLGLALLELVQGEAAAALARLESLARPAHPGEAALRALLRARALAAAGDYGQALAGLLDAPDEDDLFADRVIGASLRARLLHRTGEVQAARESAEKATRLAGDLGQDETSPAPEVREALRWLAEVPSA